MDERTVVSSYMGTDAGPGASLDFTHDRGVSSWLPRDSRHILDMTPIPAAGKVIDMERSLLWPTGGRVNMFYPSQASTEPSAGARLMEQYIYITKKRLPNDRRRSPQLGVSSSSQLLDWPSGLWHAHRLAFTW